MGSWFQWLVDWVSGAIGSLYAAYNAVMLQALAGLVALIPGAPSIEQIVPYLESANVWVPVTESLALLSAFFSWRSGYIAVKVLRTFLPTIR